MRFSNILSIAIAMHATADYLEKGLMDHVGVLSQELRNVCLARVSGRRDEAEVVVMSDSEDVPPTPREWLGDQDDLIIMSDDECDAPGYPRCALRGWHRYEQERDRYKPVKWTVKAIRSLADLLPIIPYGIWEAEREAETGGSHGQGEKPNVGPKNPVISHPPRLYGPPVRRPRRRSKTKKASAPKSVDAKLCGTGILLHTEARPQPPMQYKTVAQLRMGWTVPTQTITNKTALLKFKTRMGLRR